jgi:hypothetical protein
MMPTCRLNLSSSSSCSLPIYSLITATHWLRFHLSSVETELAFVSPSLATRLLTILSFIPGLD